LEEKIQDDTVQYFRNNVMSGTVERMAIFIWGEKQAQGSQFSSSIFTICGLEER
jgi:hypothetical protein